MASSLRPLIEFFLHTKYRILDLEVKMCKVLNSIRCSNGYAGRDPQGGTSDGSLLSKFSKNFFF